MNQQKNSINDQLTGTLESRVDVHVEDCVAQNIVGLLNDKAEHLSLADAQRLAVARNNAVDRLAAQQARAVSVAQNGHTLQWFGYHLAQHRVISTALLVGAVLLAFFVVQQYSINNHIEDSDAFLLASDLPPEAFADKGFDTWVDSK